MKQPFYKSPTAHKWGLYICLLGSLGFNLSMNPEHTNFARNTATSFNMMEFAQTLPPAETAAPAASADGVIEGKSKSRKFAIGGKDGKAYSVVVTQTGDQTTAQFNPVTEGKACDNCGTRRFVEGASLDNVDGLTQTLLGMTATLEGAQPAATVATAPAKPAKKGEALEFDASEYAAICEEKSDEAKMKCHKDKLIELSGELRNHSEQESIVTSYFKEYLQSDIKAALTSNRTIKTSRLSILSDDLSNEDAHESFKLGNEIVRSLTEKLESKNGAAVRKNLARLSAEAILVQASQARLAMEQSFRGGDFIQDRAQFESGLTILKDLEDEALDISAGLMRAYKSNKTKDKSDLSNFASSLDTLFTPVDTLYKEVEQKYFSMGDMIYSKVGVDALKSVSGMPGNLGPITPSIATSGSANADAILARANVRGGDNNLLLPPTQSSFPQQGGYQNRAGQGPIGCATGLILNTATGRCDRPNQPQGGYNQSNGLPPPNGTYIQRGASF